MSPVRPRSPAPTTPICGKLSTTIRQHGARYPSGKGEVCKTFMRRFDPDPRLQIFPNTIQFQNAFAPGADEMQLGILPHERSKSACVPVPEKGEPRCGHRAELSAAIP